MIEMLVVGLCQWRMIAAFLTKTPLKPLNTDI